MHYRNFYCIKKTLDTRYFRSHTLERECHQNPSCRTLRRPMLPWYFSCSRLPIPLKLEYLNPPRPTTPTRIRRVFRARRRTIIRRRAGRLDPALPSRATNALVPILNSSPGILLVHPIFRIGSMLAPGRTKRGRVDRQAEKPMAFQHTRGVIDAARADGTPPTGQRGWRGWRAFIDYLHTVSPTTR